MFVLASVLFTFLASTSVTVSFYMPVLAHVPLLLLSTCLHRFGDFAFCLSRGLCYSFRFISPCALELAMAFACVLACPLRLHLPISLFVPLRPCLRQWLCLRLGPCLCLCSYLCVKSGFVAYAYGCASTSA